MDIWQDIHFNGRELWLESPKRLYQFLLLRALNHCELYLNPRTRSLDNTLYTRVKKNFEHGEVSSEELLSWGDERLERWLAEKGDIKPHPNVISPDDLEWFKFKTKKEAKAFAKKEKRRFSHTEQLRAFTTGLDWLVKSGRHLTPLKFVLPKRKVEQLEYLSKKHEGWYVYCFREDT